METTHFILTFRAHTNDCHCEDISKLADKLPTQLLVRVGKRDQYMKTGSVGWELKLWRWTPDYLYGLQTTSLSNPVLTWNSILDFRQNWMRSFPQGHDPETSKGDALTLSLGQPSDATFRLLLTSRPLSLLWVVAVPFLTSLPFIPWCELWSLEDLHSLHGIPWNKRKNVVRKGTTTLGCMIQTSQLEKANSIPLNDPPVAKQDQHWDWSMWGRNYSLT